MTMGKKLIKDEAATPKDSTSGKDEIDIKMDFSSMAWRVIMTNILYLHSPPIFYTHVMK